MNQTELLFLQEALVEKVNKILTAAISTNESKKKEHTSEEKPKTTKKGESK